MTCTGTWCNIYYTEREKEQCITKKKLKVHYRL
jgi:hypothetical protein